MSINFGQFPTPRLPLQSGDIVVGYQIVNSVPTLAQYSMLQLAGVIGPIIGGLPPTGPAGGDLSGTYPNPTVSAVHATSGSLSGVSYTGGAITGSTIATTTVAATVTGVTGVRVDNTTQLATDAFVNQQIASSTANVPFPLVGGIYNQASLGTGASFVIFVSGGTISSVVSVIGGGTGYAVGDLLLVIGGNYDAVLRVTNVVGGVIQSGGLAVIYGGTGYTTGATTSAVPVPPGQRTVTFTGVLASNATFIIQNGTFLTAARRIQFNNNTTGAFTVTVKLSNGAGGSVGTGVVLVQGTNNNTATLVETDGVNDVWLADTPLGIGALPASATGRFLGAQVFTAASSTYTPTAGTTSVIVEVQGGGGGGGGAVATGVGQYSTAAGGCCGAYGKARITSGFSGVTVTVGAAGTAGASGTGGTGGTSSFGALVSCPGGIGGGASTAVVNTTVGFFPEPTTVSTPSFTGGGTVQLVSRSTDADGAALLYSGGNNLIGGGGASSLFGAGGRAVSGTGAGNAATGNGAAGSGGTQGNASSAAQNGGAGSAGIVIVYEYT